MINLQSERYKNTNDFEKSVAEAFQTHEKYDQKKYRYPAKTNLRLSTIPVFSLVDGEKRFTGDTNLTH